MKDNEEYKKVQDQLSPCVEEELEVEEQTIKEIRKELKKFKAKVKAKLGKTENVTECDRNSTFPNISAKRPKYM